MVILMMMLGVLGGLWPTPAHAAEITVCPPMAQCEDTPNPWDATCHLQTSPPEFDWRTRPGKVETCWTPHVTSPNKVQLHGIACKINQYRHLTIFNEQNCPAGALPDWVYAYGNLSWSMFEEPDLTYIPPPVPNPACTHSFQVSNSFVDPFAREIRIQAPMGYLLPGNLELTVEPNSTWRPIMSLPYQGTNPNVYIANLLVPRGGGPWQVTLKLPPQFLGCQIKNESWPDPSLLPGQFVGAKPKTPQQTAHLLFYIGLHRGNIAYIESQMKQFPVGSPMWAIMDRSRQALLATIARTQTVIMDPIDTNYLVDPPAVTIVSLGPDLTASPPVTAAMILTVNNWHKELMALEANLHRAAQWIDKMNGALLAGNNTRAAALAAGADAQFQAAYALIQSEVNLRATIETQWAGVVFPPSDPSCTTVEDGEGHVAAVTALGFALEDALPLGVFTPLECVPAGSWPDELVNPTLRAALLQSALVLDTMSVLENICVGYESEPWCPQPAIAVVSPNGGESWAAGSARTITWTSQNITGPVKIQLSTNGGSSYTDLIASTQNTGSWAWTLPIALSTTARIKVVSVDIPMVFDASNANFTIQRSATVTVPNGGQTWHINTDQAIRWTSIGIPASEQVRVQVSRNGGSTWTNLIDPIMNTPWFYNTGCALWPVGGPATTTAKVRVLTMSAPIVNDTSNANFTVATCPAGQMCPTTTCE